MTEWRLSTVLAVSAYVYRTNGNAWTSVTTAETRGVPSSASEVIDWLTDPDRPIPDVTGADVSKARDALTWILSAPDRAASSPYELDMCQQLRNVQSVGVKSAASAGTLIPVYVDGLKKHASKDAWDSLSGSQYVDTISPGTYSVIRCEPHVSSFTKHSGESVSETQSLVILRDENGNGIKWFDGKARGFRIGQAVKVVSGRVKGPDNFQGVRLTRATHVKIS